MIPVGPRGRKVEVNYAFSSVVYFCIFLGTVVVCFQWSFSKIINILHGNNNNIIDTVWAIGGRILAF